uniref:Uncharacterized protein n=1 Tax=Arundo donax TaxID=35708 RepID=A0A0A8ZE25_ARUDO
MCLLERYFVILLHRRFTSLASLFHFFLL